MTAAPAPLWHPMLIEGALALHDNRIPEAERLLKGYLKQDPFDARAIRMLAEVAGRIGRYRDAENLLRRAIELAPGFTAARANLALVLYRLNRPTEALAAIAKTTLANLDDFEAGRPCANRLTAALLR